MQCEFVYKLHQFLKDGRTDSRLDLKDLCTVNPILISDELPVESIKMNEPIRRGNQANNCGDLLTALKEYRQSLDDPDPAVRMLAKKRIGEIATNVERTRRILEHQAFLWPITRPSCCSDRNRKGLNIFVLSREGGFVACGCSRCYKSSYAKRDDFPDQEHCGQTMWFGQDREKNYCYVCKTCGYRMRVADVVPPWQEYFPENGLRAPGD